MDLTKITTPFGLLDAETQKALKAHGGPYEIYDGPDWIEYRGEPWGPLHSVYRVRPEPPKPREVWVVFYPDGSVLCTRETEKYAFQTTVDVPGSRAVRFVEVL